MIKPNFIGRETLSTTVGEKVTMTPENAAAILKMPGILDVQRNISRSHVDVLSHDMKAGRWLPYQAEIVFAVLPKGSVFLIDGQHVLHACALSGITVELSQRVIACANMEEVRNRFGKFGVQRSRTASQIISTMNLNTMLDPSLQITVVSAYKALLKRLSNSTRKNGSDTISTKYPIGNALVKSHTQALAKSCVHIMDEVAFVLDEARFYKDDTRWHVRGPRVSVSRIALMHMIPLIMSRDKVARRFWVDVCAGRQTSTSDGVGHALDVLNRSGKKHGGKFADDTMQDTLFRLERCLEVYRSGGEQVFIKGKQFDIDQRCQSAGIPTVAEWIKSYRTAKKVADGSDSAIRWSTDKRGFVAV